MIKQLKLILYWAPRLPWRFTVSLVLLLAVCLMLVGVVISSIGLRGLAEVYDVIAGLLGLPSFKANATGGILNYFIVALRVFFEGALSLGLLALSLLLSYNLAALIDRKFRRASKLNVHDPVAPASGPRWNTPIERFMKARKLDELRIGIILAGGGAKGAYQAGALKAIHEFLEANNALDKVRMIAGTSIGSWNAMFWLAGLIKPPAPNAASMHEQWWRSIHANRLVEFAFYMPMMKNHFLNTNPWQRAFENIFVQTPLVREHLDKLFFKPGSSGSGESPIHFYFTRSNVEQGHLEFATNNNSLPDMMRPKWGTANIDDTEPMVSGELYELITKDGDADPFQRTKLAVFASMDLPPLFPYTMIRTKKNEWFEDGGVVDNLPMRFGTEIEGCNLLFVLPLNASFAEEADQRSIAKRLFRVLDVRQGVLEQNSIKLARLYNERTRLVRELISREPNSSQVPSGSGKAPSSSPPRELPVKAHLKFVRSSLPDPVSVFAICPQAPLDIGTAEFWKTEEAGKAFDLMYVATKSELEEEFLQTADPNCLRVVLVSPRGERTYNMNF